MKRLWQFMHGCGRDSAMLVVGCSAPVTGLCFPAIASCIYIDGPHNATTQYVSATTIAPNAFYNLQIAWEASAPHPCFRHACHPLRPCSVHAACGTARLRMRRPATWGR
jgi:hypothetical protein